ncbi:MAG: tellurium resistance protein [Paenirhodobacter sp.]|uniref:SLAC1 family transporter n=1 Tax=Paenirhodobacter sp. TaxID=1965326 RepID=UPI003D14FA44
MNFQIPGQIPGQAPAGLWRRVPPAIFPPVLGLLGLGLGWRRGIVEFALPQGLADAALGAIMLLALFALMTYVVKMARRPSVVLDELKILPGRAGLSAAVLCLYLLAVVFAPYSGGLARGFLGAGIVFHLGLTAALIWTLATGPKEQRRVTPVWHLGFTGWIVCALAAQALGLATLAIGLFWLSLVIAVGIWTASLQQFSRETVPAPLRPLLAIHLAPAALIGSVATGFQAEAIAQAFGLLSALLLFVFVVRGRWLLAAGFSPFWGALTFPLAATANFWLAMGGVWRLPGAFVLIGATLFIPFVAYQVMKLWAKGQLAVKTNAATA